MSPIPWRIGEARPIVDAMDTPVGGHRTTRQLRNDVDDIYDILGAIGHTVDEHTVTLNQHTATLGEHTVTLNEHSGTLGEHTVKLDHIIDLLHAK